MEECLFCQIIKKESPADLLYEDKSLVAFKDIYPVAPVHILIVPRKHILTVDHLGDEDKDLIGEMFLTAQRIAREQGLSRLGYRLTFNVGKDAGQTVDHLHLHLIGGKKLPFA